MTTQEIENIEHINTIADGLLGKYNTFVLKYTAEKNDLDYEDTVLSTLIDIVYDMGISQDSLQDSESILYANAQDIIELFEGYDVLKNFEDNFSAYDTLRDINGFENHTEDYLYDEYGLYLNVDYRRDRLTQKDETYIDFSKGDIPQQYNPKVLDWLFNGNIILDIDGLYSEFYKAKEQKRHEIIKDVWEYKLYTKLEKLNIIADVLKYMLNDYLMSNKIDIDSLYNEVLTLYNKVNNIELEFVQCLNERATEVTRTDIENGYFFMMITSANMIKINRNIDKVSEAIKVFASKLGLNKTTLHYLHEYDLDYVKYAFSKPVENIIRRDGSVLFLYQLDKNKTTKLKNIIQFSMERKSLI